MGVRTREYSSWVYGTRVLYERDVVRTTEIKVHTSDTCADINQPNNNFAGHATDGAAEAARARILRRRRGGGHHRTGEEEDRGSRIKDRGSRAEDRGSRVEDRRSRVEDRGSRAGCGVRVSNRPSRAGQQSTRTRPDQTRPGQLLGTPARRHRHRSARLAFGFLETQTGRCAGRR